ncbi:serine/threonine-protein kinase CTR1-like isoform X1 [Salvia splendens]|uniref:serine/threonine-protein kinase CTR1-like isoform X1 n=1 Tax=Salvia splendens TaxID=180675 RepID=UPI001C263AC3|nr:serine/threonine-protein kinase CTR1-like isoform X1 [Salvia splendens]
MEMPGRRSNYTLLSQIPDDPPYLPAPPKFSAANPPPQPYYYESHSADTTKLKSDRIGGSAAAYDWDAIDQRMISQQSRIGATSFAGGSFGLQRQSSGSSFGESSISGDYYPPSLSNPEGVFSHFSDGGSDLRVKAAEASGRSSSRKSWAQQTEESYQLQLALALRLSSEATCADDPNLLDPAPDESAYRPSSSADAISHRFWVNGCLSYYDKIPDGFYSIHGIDPYVWAVCSDLQESGRIPSLESMKAVDPATMSSVEVIVVDRRVDPSLRELQNQIHTKSSSSLTANEVVDQLAKIVCTRMGHAASNGEEDLIKIWKQHSDNLKDCLGSVVLPIGSVSVGLCKHRSLLFKVLADIIGLPCRIAKGCKFCNREDGSSCLVRFELDREYLIDLIEKPGCLSDPDSMSNGPSTISISSPLRFPRSKKVEPTIDFRLLAKQYFLEFQSLNQIFDESLAAGPVTDAGAGDPLFPRQSEKINDDRTGTPPSLSKEEDVSRKVIGSTPLKPPPPVRHKGLPGPRGNGNKDGRSIGGNMLFQTKSSAELAFDIEELKIHWDDLVIKERIGAGSFGTVHRAEWNDSDVAVKILMEQDFHAERFKEFLREVAIMKRLRHPNIVLLMGAVTEPPNLSIVTEYLSRGSLYRLLHKHGAREMLDERRRLSMAYDVAKGMNYLHKHNPPIVHRDLKSPNLLVDIKFTVKVCDFGLSRFKANTFLSSKSAAGTPEWMAPEVLRDEPSNEKSDVYSFGVILWELATLQQPWGNLNPAQVVAAVGFKGKRLEIPEDMNPQVAAIIVSCWANEPWKRPSFSSIMESLAPLIKSPSRSKPASRGELT